MMKTIEEFRNEEAVRFGFDSWMDACMDLDDRCSTTQFIEMTDRACFEYAKQMCEEQRKIDLKHVKIKKTRGYSGDESGFDSWEISEIDDNSILTSPLATDNI